MFNLGMGEITVILLLALIFLGPKKLPELASGLGRIIRDIRKATNDVKNEIQLDDAIRKPFEELRDAVTLHPDELKRRDKLRKDLEEAKRKAEAEIKALTATVAEANAAEAKLDDQFPEHHLGELPPPRAVTPIPVPPHLPSPGSGPIGGIPAPSSSLSSPPPSSSSSSPSSSSPNPSSGPIVAAAPGPTQPAGAPPGTVPVAGRDRPSMRGLPLPARSGRPPVAASAPVPPPTRLAEKTNVTQFLSEADLIPPGAPPPLPAHAPPPAPPHVPGATGKIPPATPGSTGKVTAAAAAASETSGPHKDDKKDDVG